MPGNLASLRCCDPWLRIRQMSQNSALVIIDVQLGAFESKAIPPIHNGTGLLATIRKLISRARTAGAPVIYVQHNGPAGHPLERGTPPARSILKSPLPTRI
jgi:nicotinamidase-related amidase